MMGVEIMLRLTDGVQWGDRPIHGSRLHALLAAVVAAGPGGATVDELVEEVWGSRPPADERKALQVLVSRLRSATIDGIVTRTERGYRLGLERHEVDVLAREDHATAAESALGAARLDDAAEEARAALRLGETPRARRVAAIIASRQGNHTEALPTLTDVLDDEPYDEQVVAALLRSTASLHGPAAGLQRYEDYRQQLAEDLGTDPGPALQEVQRELLAADRPLRSGVQYPTTPLLGRAADITALNARLATSRLVSIVGPGGLGKTRLAHVVASGSQQPVVHVVGLVAVNSAEEVLETVAAALGVRESASARRALTAQQLGDVRSRIAGSLARAPSLLVLDNCEHVVDGVAALVTFLLGAVADLRVLTTSRTPLRIAGEQVYALDQLSTGDATELFCQRARALRPGATLEATAVHDLVLRLDGLPLAIELAAAKVQAMTVRDIASRLSNRFEFLRGGDRSAPDRHQTLLAVIDWSWNLLSDTARQALAQLSVFADGFAADGAETMLGPRALQTVGELCDQSLLSVVEHNGTIRYRMLETVRDFAHMQLVDRGEEEAALAAQRAWARELCAHRAATLHSPQQFAAMDTIGAEEQNLADILHRALASGDNDTAVIVLSALGTFWMISGAHHRILGYFGDVEAAATAWHVPTHLTEHAARALSALTLTAAFMPGQDPVPRTRALLDGLVEEVRDPAVLANVLISRATATADPLTELWQLTEHRETFVAVTSRAFLAARLENSGDLTGALDVLTPNLPIVDAAANPWLIANQRLLLAQLLAERGEHAGAEPHATRALSTFERLNATDDVAQCHTFIACAHLAAGDLAEAEAQLQIIAGLSRRGYGLDSAAIVNLGQAEVALARGEATAGLEHYREALHQAHEATLPALTNDAFLAPWTLLAESAALAAHARHEAHDAANGEELWQRLRTNTAEALAPHRSRHDYPLLGMALFALGCWALLRQALDVPDAARLLVLATHFEYNQLIPSMRIEPLFELVSQCDPSVLAELEQTYGQMRGEDLLAAARHTLKVTSCADRS